MWISCRIESMTTEPAMFSTYLVHTVLIVYDYLALFAWLFVTPKVDDHMERMVCFCILL